MNLTYSDGLQGRPSEGSRMTRLLFAAMAVELYEDVGQGWVVYMLVTELQLINKLGGR